MTMQNRKTLRLDFGNLPLVEVALRLTFANPIRLRFNSINSLHSKLRREFESLSEPTRIDAPPGRKGPIEFSPGEILGAQFEGNRDGLVVLLTKYGLALRWLKQLGSDAPKYPRFSPLHDTLLSTLEACRSVFEGLDVAVVNMFYTNVIERADPSKFLADYFTPDVRIGVFDSRNAREVQKVEFGWAEQDFIELRLSLDRVLIESGDESVEGYKLTTSAGVDVSKYDKKEPSVVLDDMHVRLCEFFAQVMSARAKAEWKLRVAEE